MRVTTELQQSRLDAHRLSLHAQCLLCGHENPQGLMLEFRVLADGRVEAAFSCASPYQGYTGYLHGGIIAALLDSAMTNCLFAHGKAALTGELNVRFLKPVALRRAAIVSARLMEASTSLFRMEATLRQNGRLMATATARFMEAGRAGVALAKNDAGKKRSGGQHE